MIPNDDKNLMQMRTGV